MLVPAQSRVKAGLTGGVLWSSHSESLAVLLVGCGVLWLVIAHRLPNVRVVIDPLLGERVERWRPLRRVPLGGA